MSDPLRRAKEIVEARNRGEWGQQDIRSIELLNAVADEMLAVIEAAKAFANTYSVYFEVQGGLVGRPMSTLSTYDVAGTLKGSLKALDTALAKHLGETK